MKDSVPRINTLRNDGKVPRTSDCFTPRTMTGNDGAFKGPEYGNCIEYHRGPFRFEGWIWIGAAILLVAAIGLVFWSR